MLLSRFFHAFLHFSYTISIPFSLFNTMHGKLSKTSGKMQKGDGIRRLPAI